ncbi:Hint domain-containing protein [Nioella aestuarii]|uniref:Hint domain-containing protein n=1 Tax=Nioella aestuarii TaxID=1662864 RepID=UPI003D7F66E9
MATEILSISLTPGTSKVKGKDIVSDENDTQIVTVTDGGDLDGGTFIFEFWGKDTPSTAGEGPGGDDVFKLDLASFDDDFTILVTSMTPGDEFWISNYDTWTTVGSVHTFTYTGSDGASHTLVIDAQSQNNWGEATVVCFTSDTWIATPDGTRLITELSVGDNVVCGDGHVRPIRWIGQRKVTRETLRQRPSMRPIRIAPNALGPGQPASSLGLSPQHKVRIQHWQADLLFGSDEVLVPAKALLDLPHVTQPEPQGTVTYHHLLLDGHHTVLANGLRCETLMPAQMAQKALDAEARAELMFLMPVLAEDLNAIGPLCHRALSVNEARLLMRNIMPCQAAA